MTSWPSWLPKEPDAEQAPVRVWRDWVLAAAVLVTATAEIVLHDDLRWRPAVLAVGLILATAMLWRRTHPLAMVAIAFGTFMVVDIASMLIPRGEPDE